MTWPGRGRHPLGRGARVSVIVPIALACIALPFVLLTLQDNDGLIDDTRAFFGAGTSAGVPEVTQVACLKRRYGSNSDRGIGISDWSCTLSLAPAAEAPAADPYAGMTYEEAMAENDRRIAALGDLLRLENRLPASIERVVATNRTGDLPVLRRLSGEGEPPRFGIVWSGWELAGRWLFWGLISALFIGIGIACLFAARAIWQRPG